MTIALGTVVTGTASGSNLTFTKPSVSVGDVMLVIWAGSANTAATTPTGWTASVGVGGSGSSPQIVSYTRTIDGTEGSTFTFAYGSSVNVQGFLIPITGADANFSVDVTAQHAIFNNVTDSVTGPITRLANEVIIAAAVHYTAGGGTPVLSSATGTSLAANGSGNFGLSIRQQTQAVAGASGAFNWTWDRSGAVGDAIVLAIRPSGQNIPPTVNVGADAVLIYGDTYTGVAAASDVEGPVTYAWTIVSAPSGSTATITNPTAATMTIKPNKVGPYTFRCTVTDNSSATVTDDVLVTVRASMWVRVGGVAKPAQRRIRKNGAVA